MAICDVCFRHCKIEEGATGFCGGRTCRDGKIVAANYGRLTALAGEAVDIGGQEVLHHVAHSLVFHLFRILR